MPKPNKCELFHNGRTLKIYLKLKSTTKMGKHILTATGYEKQGTIREQHSHK